jgi:general secretion pathway protein G
MLFSIVRNVVQHKSSSRGTTLVEVLIVLAILALIAGGVAIVAIPQWQKAQVDSAKNDLKNLSSIIDIYRRDHPECPKIEDLKNEHLFKQSGNDPWNHPYQILTVGGDCSVYSLGRDGKQGTEDDLCEPAGTCGGAK